MPWHADPQRLRIPLAAGCAVGPREVHGRYMAGPPRDASGAPGRRTRIRRQAIRGSAFRIALCTALGCTLSVDYRSRLALLRDW